MLGRKQVREKLVEIVFSNQFNKQKTYAVIQAYDQNIEALHYLYLTLLDLLVNVYESDTNLKNSLLKDFKFFDWILGHKPYLDFVLSKRKINWRLEEVLLQSMVKKIKADYNLKSVPIESIQTQNFLLIRWFENIILSDETLLYLLEEKDISWINVSEVPIEMVIKTIDRFEIRSSNRMRGKILNIYKNDEIKEFAHELLTTALDHQMQFKSVIQDYSVNWSIDRIPSIDISIMILALTEIYHMPSIPISVTMNEYIDIAGWYCMDNSPKYINGILHAVSQDLIKNNLLIKTNA